LYFWANLTRGDPRPVLSGPSGAIKAGWRISRQADYPASGPVRLPLLSVIPFKNRRFLVSAALRRGGDFGMVPPI
jgi:hypothetical protein